MTKTFEAGKTYWTRSIVDADSIISIKVAARTAKTITTDKGKTLRISVWDDAEQVKPWGSYSMCPIVGADRVMTSVQPMPSANENLLARRLG